MNKIKPFIATEVRVYLVNCRHYADQSFAKILQRYARSFGKINLATRVITESNIRNGYVAIDDYCDNIDNIQSIPRFVIGKIPSSILKHLENANLIILRIPALTALKYYGIIKKKRKTYMTEVMGCAWDAYWNHGLIGKIIAPFLFLRTKEIVSNANYCVYVTQSFLQKRYPHRGRNIGISNVEISSINTPKEYDSFNKHKFTILTAAGLNVKYKGQKYVIKAISRLKKKYGIIATYYLAGKGDSERLERIAKRNKVANQIVFLGMIPKEALLKKMREVDFYIQPSLQEGLPRSLIEAMSQGCICFGTHIAGIPELLPEKQLFKKKSISSIIETMRQTINNNNLRVISKINVAKAKEYDKKILDKKRTGFYDIIKRSLGE